MEVHLVSAFQLKFANFSKFWWTFVVGISWIFVENHASVDISPEIARKFRKCQKLPEFVNNAQCFFKFICAIQSFWVEQALLALPQAWRRMGKAALGAYKAMPASGGDDSVVHLDVRIGWNIWWRFRESFCHSDLRNLVCCLGRVPVSRTLKNARLA